MPRIALHHAILRLSALLLPALLPELSCLSAAPADAAPAPPDASFGQTYCTRERLGVTWDSTFWLLERAEAGWNGNRDADREAAVTRAREQARTTLQQKVCTGRSPEDCAAVLPYFYDYYYVDPSTRMTCAVVGLHNDYLQRTNTVVVAEEAIKALLPAVTRAVSADPAPLVIEPIRTPQGCAVPALDWAQLFLAGSLRSLPQRRPDEAKPGDYHLTTEAASTGNGLVLSLSLRRDGPRTPLGTARLDRAQWPMPPAGSCAADQQLGVQDPNPLGLSLSYAAPDSRFCKGAIFPIRLHTAAPARVHLYSVAPDGSSYHLWPEPDQAPALAGDITIDGTAWPTAGGDEKIVAAAR